MNAQPKKLTAAIIVLFTFPALLLMAQDKPDRPPWAQPSSSPQSPPPAEPVKPPEKNDEAPSSRNTVKVNVNLVTVLVSVLDEHNRPAPNLPIEAFQILEEGNLQKIDVFE
ncbi:MAG: hypothetical protein WBQ89_03945, partial [Candidatus Acidiferrum sp.]